MVKTMFQVMSKIIITTIAVIIILAVLLFLYANEIISFGKKTIKVETELGDKIAVVVDPYNPGTIFDPDLMPVTFKINGKKGYNEPYEFWLAKEFDKSSIEISYLFEKKGIRYYRVNITVDDSLGTTIKPEFLLVDEINNCWDIVSYDSAIYLFAGVDIRMDMYLPLARYCFLQGEQDWIMKYGDAWVKDKDMEVIELINSIANGLTELNGRVFGDEEIYNKCVELIRSI